MSGRFVSIPGPDGAFQAFCALPSGSDPAPALLVLQEIFGVNANVRSVAEAYATQGYVALAPDLFWRQAQRVDLDPALAEDRGRAMALFGRFDETAAVKDCAAAAAYLRGLPACNGRVGAVGYCMGGKLAYLLACESDIDAAVSYYGVGIQSALDRAGDSQVPQLLHLAADDHLCPTLAQLAISSAATATGGHIRVMTHIGAGHAFARRGAESFVSAAAEVADGATLDFLRSALGACG
jgi:carboxymethylenebutenolidase